MDLRKKLKEFKEVLDAGNRFCDLHNKMKDISESDMQELRKLVIKNKDWIILEEEASKLSDRILNMI